MAATATDDVPVITCNPSRYLAKSGEWCSLPSALIHRDGTPGLRRVRRARTPALVAIGMILLGGCAADHYLIHPHQPAPGVVVWSADSVHDQIQVHVEGARPPGAGPFPTVIVHPEEDETALAMRGVIWDLAARGYVAIAPDYKRWIEGKFRRSYFTWQTGAEVTLSIDLAGAYPEVDKDRIGALGFSEGAVLSLLMAAYEPDRLKAVVAYSPITDFPHWYAGQRSGLSPLILFELARWQFRADSRTDDDEEFQRMLRLASPLFMAEYIRAPVLLVHGAEDTMAPLEESERMAERLKASNNNTELLVVPGGERFFNFRQPQQATLAWDATLEWLNHYLRVSPRPDASRADAR